MQMQLEDAYTECKQANSALLSLMTEEAASSEMKWLPAIQASYNEIVGKLEAHLQTEEKLTDESKDQVKTERSSNVQLAKIRMPPFDRDLREYPAFKRDFEKQVMPHLTENTAPYALRSCLGKEPLVQVKSVDDDVLDMWKRLDEKYGDPTKITDAIINDIRRAKTIREGESRRFVDFVGIVEDGYRDLKRLGLETEITTTSSISIIERKLPADIRKEWAKLLSADEDTVNRADKFSRLLKFLLAHKRAVEYDMSELRVSGSAAPAKGTVYHATADEHRDKLKPRSTSKCLCHDAGEHSTSDCRLYLSKPIQERMALLKEKGACFSCLKCGHRSRDCRRKRECGVNGCKAKHHVTLHEDKPAETGTPSVSGASSTCTEQPSDACLLQIQRIRTPRAGVNVLWDNASSISLVTYYKATTENLRGTPVQLTITKVGGEEETKGSAKYQLPLIDRQGKTVNVEVYGMDKITSDIQRIGMNGVSHIFGVPSNEIERPQGTVDVLIGYDYAGFHPEKEKSSGHLILLRNRFGRCIDGTHPSIKEIRTMTLREAKPIHYVKGVKIDDFYNIENLGIRCIPRCGGCKCGKCAPGTSDYTLKEERELQLIERGLQFDEREGTWREKYPWIKDSHALPDNRKAALGRLTSIERRLERNPEHARVYQGQIEDMVESGVAKKLTKEKIYTYTGPIHYISYHDVLKPDSKSTPVRIVFNSSAKYLGHVLNDYWAKGPDLLNNHLGILVRFREYDIGFIGDVKKMYHTVKTGTVEQHTHRFLWRDINPSKEPDTYVIQRVSFGDKPSGTIATVPMRKTAEMSREIYPQAANTIINNSYMDDIVDSVHSKEQAIQITDEIERVLTKGGFKIKGWFYSNDQIPKEMTLEPVQESSSIEKVLGVIWSTNRDQFRLRTNIAVPSKKAKNIIPATMTKRTILSQINRVYDPLGLASPVTIRAKILMRQLWTAEETLDWDDPILERQRQLARILSRPTQHGLGHLPEMSQATRCNWSPYSYNVQRWI